LSPFKRGIFAIPVQSSVFIEASIPTPFSPGGYKEAALSYLIITLYACLNKNPMSRIFFVKIPPSFS